MWFSNRSDTNRPVQALKIARDGTFWISEIEKLFYPSIENKGADLHLWIRKYKLFVFSLCGSYHNYILVECRHMLLHFMRSQTRISAISVL